MALHVTGPEDAPRIQVRFNEGTEMEEVALLDAVEPGHARGHVITVDPEETTVGPQIYPAATVGPGNGGGARSGGMPSGAGGGAGYPTGPVLVPPSAMPREALAPKPELEPLQFTPLLSGDTPSVRITAEDGDRRVEITIENPVDLKLASQLATEHITALVQALGGAK